MAVGRSLPANTAIHSPASHVSLHEAATGNRQMLTRRPVSKKFSDTGRTVNICKRQDPIHRQMFTQATI